MKALLGTFFLSLALTALAAPVFAASSPLGGDSKSPIRVTADNMTYEPDKNTVLFSGNVEVQRDDFRMWSAKLTMYMKARKDTKDAKTVKDAKDGQASEAASGLDAMKAGDLDRIVAEKNVRFRMDTKSGTAQKATWLADREELVLEGNPVLLDGQNSVTGKRIRYFVRENRSEVEGGTGKRVEAVFSSNGQGK